MISRWLDEIRNFLDRFTGRFAYRKRFVFWSLVFGTVSPFPATWLVTTDNYFLEQIDRQITGNRIQEKLGLLLSLTAKSLVLITGADSKDFKIDLTQKAILRHAKLLFEEETSVPILRESSTSILTLATELQNPEKTPEQEIIITHQLLQYLIQLIHDIGYTYELVLSTNEKIASLQQKMLFRLPEEQLMLSDLTQLEIAISYFEGIIYPKTFGKEKDHEQQTLTFDKEILQIQYLNSLSQLLDWVKNVPSQGMGSPELTTLVLRAIAANDKYRIQIIKNINIQLEESRKGYIWEKSIVLLDIIISLIIMTCYIIFRVLTRHLLQLRTYIQDLAQGNFSSTIAVNQKDEVGEIAHEFNKMGTAIRTIIEELYKLGKQLADLTKKIRKNVKARELSIIQQEQSIDYLFKNASQLSAKLNELAKIIQGFTENSERFVIGESGKEGLIHLQERMLLLAEASEKILITLMNVHEKVSSTRQMTRFMTKISDQAKLLSLNAAIETLNIGEHKNIFSDITLKIQRFAETTAISTNEIQSIINAMSSSVSAGRSTAEICLREISEGANRFVTVTNQLSGVAVRGKAQVHKFKATREMVEGQARLSENIVELISELKIRMQESSQFVHEVHKTIELMSEKTVEHNHVLQKIFHS